MPSQEPISSKTSIYKQLRELKKQDHTIFNCLSSIVEDASFVSEIKVLYPDLPLLANLRCGLWYAPRPDGTCYFKSTDGHQGHHQFSTTRLNWHVAEIAARRGGCIIVDATRKGKRAPDAMSKTIPIWTAVINRAVARVRLHDAQKEQRRRSYTTQDGEVLTSVADTQTSISVRTDEPSSASSAGSLAPPAEAAASPAPATGRAGNQNNSSSHTPLLEQQQCQRRQQQQQQQQKLQQHGMSQQQATGSACSCVTEVEALLVDCIGDSCIELLSGLTVNVSARPSTPDQVQAQQPHSAAAAVAAAAGRIGSIIRSPSNAVAQGGGSPTSLTSSLHRSISLHISPQPSLQEWLDEADMLHRLSLHHHDCCRSPVRRARLSCHSIGGGGSSDISSVGAAVAAVEGPDVLYASSAPATSCFLASSLQRSNSCVRSMSADVPAAASEMHQQQQQRDDSLAGAAAAVTSPATQAEPAAFSLTGGEAADPVTPRLGCCGALPTTFVCTTQAIQDDHISSAAVESTTAAAAGFGLTSHQLHLLQQQQQQQQRQSLLGSPVVAAGPATMGSVVPAAASGLGCRAAGGVAGDFAFPPPYLLAQSMGSSLAEAAGSVGAAAGPGSTSSSCGCSGLEMPVVVLNGTSHQPGDATSILDIWRGTDLEDVATLPGISDFQPGVYHYVPEEQHEEEDCLSIECMQQQEEEDQSGSSGTAAQDPCSDGWVLVNGQQARAAAAAASTAMSTDSSWIDEETGMGYDNLCAFAPPSLAVGAAVDDAASSACSVGSAACLQPNSPSACSSCSSGSGPTTHSGNSRRVAAAAGSVSTAAVADDNEQLWDTELHLPLWVPARERQAIEAKLDGWVERLLEVGADVRGLAAQLHKPLRPLWVTQDSLIWTNQVAHPSTLPFTPLLLVSASQPHQCERQAARAFGSVSSGVSSALGLQDLDDLSDDEVPGSSKAARVGRSPGKPGGGVQQPDSQAQLSSWSYVYVPGAGDDEESWAGGLTPALFWDNCAALISCGPAGLAGAVKQLLAQHKSMAYSTALSGSAMVRQQQLFWRCGGSAVHGPPSQHHELADKHHPAPKGCAALLGDAITAAFRVVKAAPGAYWLGSTGLALGNLEGATAADVWRTVDAVLCCGTSLSPALQHEYQAMQLSQANAAAVPSSAGEGCGALCGSAPAGACGTKAVAGTGAGLCFKPTYSWHGGSHTLDPVSSSFSSCGGLGQQQQQQVQQQHQQLVSVDATSAAGDAATGSQGNLQISKLDVPAAPSKQATKRKGGMLSELLSKARPCQQQHRAPHHAHTGSADSIISCSSAASDSSSDSHGSSSYYSTSSDDAAAASLPRLKWLPIQSAKKDRASLKQHLQEALEFLSAHLAAGHLVLVHDMEGHDTCVCVAVAALLACFSPPEASATAAAADSAAVCEPRFVARWAQQAGKLGSDCLSSRHQQQSPQEPVSKHSVRQRLALVSGYYPVARPTRGSLKQVYNFFEERRRAGLAGHS